MVAELGVKFKAGLLRVVTLNLLGLPMWPVALVLLALRVRFVTLKQLDLEWLCGMPTMRAMNHLMVLV